jgi:hypothetical protein
MHRLHILAIVIALGACAHAYDTWPALTRPIADEVGRLEVNSLYDGDGKLTLRQLVGWDWYESEATWHCVFWRMVRDGDLVPRRDWQRGGYVVRFTDEGVFREIRAASYAESWSQTDPEQEDLAALPREQRRGLRKR